MNMNCSDLYQSFIIRLGDDIEEAEQIAVRIISHLRRDRHDRADIDRIREDFSIMRGIDKYREELIIVNRLNDEALAYLVAQTIDLSKIIDMLKSTLKSVKSAKMSRDYASKQERKARNGIKILTEIHSQLMEYKTLSKSIC